MPGGGSEAVILPALMGGAEAATIPAFLSAAVDAAALGAAGSALMGQDPLKGALFGGLTGGALKAVAPQGLGALFGGGINPNVAETSGALSQGSGAIPNAGMLDLPWTPVNEGNASFVGPMQVASQGASSAIPNAGGGLFGGKIGQFAPYAAMGLGSTALDKLMAPEQVGPNLKPQRDSKAVRPLSREYQDVDPNSYSTPEGNRNFYKPYSMQPTYYADGGSAESPDKGWKQKQIDGAMQRVARGYALNNPLSDSAAFVVDRYRKEDTDAPFSEWVKYEYGDSPVATFLAINTKKYANGGSSSASSSNIPKSRYVKGRGDGQSDHIPAMLSDGEFVISAPVVSAIGRGSNDAGAKKLDKMQRDIMRKNYKGGKAPKSMGLGALA